MGRGLTLVQPPSSEGAGSPAVSSGLAANYAAMAVVGAAGIVINLLIAASADASALGLFSQTYVTFVVAAQLATGGLHYATLRWSAIGDRQEAESVRRKALSLVIPLSIAVAGITVALSGPIARAVDSPELGDSVRLAAVGLVFHAINKVLLAHHNGLRQMKVFAVFQACRVVFLAIAVAVILAMTTDARWLGAALTVGELTLTLAILTAHPPQLRRGRASPITVVTHRQLLSFGLKSFGGGLVQELNARVDVIALAVLVSDKDVGIYTFAATLIEGALQLLIVLRNNLNPFLAKALAKNDIAAVEELASKFRPWILFASGGLVASTVFIYKPALRLAGLHDQFGNSWPPLLILVLGLAVASPLLPFDQVFLLGGRPGLQTGVIASVICSNLALNFVLIPILGIEGAALSTAASFVAMAVAIWMFARKSFGVSLIQST